MRYRINLHDGTTNGKEREAKSKEQRTKNKEKLLAMPFALDGLDGFIVD
jgi:hypothetical protein